MVVSVRGYQGTDARRPDRDKDERNFNSSPTTDGKTRTASPKSTRYKEEGDYRKKANDIERMLDANDRRYNSTSKLDTESTRESPKSSRYKEHRKRAESPILDSRGRGNKSSNVLVIGLIR